jgi:carbon monoxide dehydrogenase subunit G
MVHVTRTFPVDRPADVVLTYLADFAHAVDWDPGTVSCVRTDAPDGGPVGVGATWRNTSKILGATSELDYRLDRLEPGRVVLVGRHTKGTADSVDDITVRPDPGGDPGRSEVTYDATITFHGVAKLAAPVMQLEFEKLGNQTREGIQKAVAALPATA